MIPKGLERDKWIFLPQIGLDESHGGIIEGDYIYYNDTAPFDEFSHEYVEPRNAKYGREIFATVKIKRHVLTVLAMLEKWKQHVPEKTDLYEKSIAEIAEKTKFKPTKLVKKGRDVLIEATGEKIDELSNPKFPEAGVTA